MKSNEIFENYVEIIETNIRNHINYQKILQTEIKMVLQMKVISLEASQI